MGAETNINRLSKSIDLIDKLNNHTDVVLQSLNDSYKSLNETFIPLKEFEPIHMGDVFTIADGFFLKMVYKAEKIMIYLVIASENAKSSVHYHDFTETFDIIKGKLHVLLDNEVQILPENAQITIEHLHYHSVSVPEDSIFIAYINY